MYHVQVGVAHSARAQAHHDFMRTRVGRPQLADDERPLQTFHYGRSHPFLPLSTSHVTPPW